ncbi:MAG: hypothetical protein WC787_04665 [Patescibacteria group bacterium]|jgi:hypothetical protein
MFIVSTIGRNPETGRVGSQIVFAYEVKDGVIVIDETRGDQEAIADIKEKGVRCLRETLVYIKPDQGLAFHEACQEVYRSAGARLSDEDEEREFEQKFSSRRDARESVPPPSVPPTAPQSAA